MVVVYIINEPTFTTRLKQHHPKNINRVSNFGEPLFRSIYGACYLNKIHER